MIGSGRIRFNSDGYRNGCRRRIYQFHAVRQIFGNINYLNVATNLAWFELNGRAEDMEKEVERYRAVTADRLNAVAQTAFREENGVVLYYKSSRGEKDETYI